jgi:DNA-binding transcriptional LysR family regulator
MLDVRRLRVLCEVAARGSFSSAAHALTLTQSAVSQHVAALEREVGLALVERGTRPVELTEAGQRAGPPRCLAVAHPLPGVEVRMLGPGAPVRHISAARPRDAYHGPAVPAMLESLRAAARALAVTADRRAAP